MMKKADNLVSAKANLLCKLSLTTTAWSGGRNQNQVVVRFWIITMMLVLVGLSTLKLR
jgi:UDP-N-acetylmuramyl pentapeptide phosphotransferase/UDP-N-acetylglucosamine-1-phosphate transferase